MNKEKKKESLQFLLAAAKEIFGEKKLLGMLVAEGAPEHKNIVEIIEDEKFIISDKIFKDNYVKLSIGKKRNIRIQLS